MPLPKPKTGETQDEYVSRCMSEAYGSDAPADRTQDQALAMCHQAWRDKDKKGLSAKQGSRPAFSVDDTPEVDEDEDEGAYMDRCIAELSGELDESEQEDDVMQEEIEGVCQDRWDEYEKSSLRNKPGVTIFRTHAEKVDGVTYVLSDETPDRLGEIISATGWDLANFKKNPIALFGHRADFPIGRWKNLQVDGGKLKGHLELAPAGTSPRIDEVRKLVEAGILKAVSVGFRSTKKEVMDEKSDPYFGPFRYLSQELVECSLVSVPANPNALAVAKSLNISPATIDTVFAGSGKRDGVRRRGFSGGSAKSHQTKRRGATMSLAQRISSLQTRIVEKNDELDAHLEKMDDSNVSDADLTKTNDLNAEIAQLTKTHAALVESEKNVAARAKANGGGEDVKPRLPVIYNTANGHDKNGAEKKAPLVSTIGKKELDLLDLLVRGGTIAYVSKMWGKEAHQTRKEIYGDDEPTRFMTDLVLRAASAPAMTTVTGWAAELVQQTYTAMMETLMPQGILNRLSARGLSLSFGRAGKINIPTRSRTPSIAGSFVGEGQAIPVRQGAFTSQALTPKKMAVITTWTREMDEHSVPAIEGILREAIQADTTVAVDSVLIDANPATAIRPAGLLNGVAAQTPTAGGGIAAVVGDLKLLFGALTTATYGNIRNPVWLMNPGEVLSLSLVSAANTGIFPFAAEVGAGNLRGVPIIDSGTVPPKTVIIVDAADFVVVGGEAPRFEISDQATLHMEDTAPADLVTGSPGTVASPQRSLFQTDSLALRMIMPLNWVQRRAGTIAWVNNVTW
jgi:HK97 family phage prohead protease/HK97 family phage major capsid protein